MKKRKKNENKRRILTAVLAGMLTVMMSMTVFATGAAPGTSTPETKGSITVTNPQKGVTYSAYRIFDVTYTTVGDKTSYSYTIAGDSEWYSTVETYAGEAEHKLTLSKAAGGNTYVVNAETGFSAASFANALQAAVSGDSPTVTASPEASGKLADDAAEGATLSLSTDLPLGYYLVMGTNAGLCSLDTTDPDAEVTDKNDVPFDKELTATGDGTPGGTTTLPAPVDEYGVTVGSVLTYTIKGEVPDTEGFEQYVYIAEDTMDVGLTMSQDVKLKINGAEISGLTSDTSGTIPGDAKDLVKGTVYYKGTTTTSGGGFILRLDMKDYADKKGQRLEITYTATVNENAVGQISKNEATLKYGNDPDDLTEGTPSEVRVFSSNVEVLKYAKQADETDTGKVLEGAEFVLQNSTGTGDAAAPGGKYYKATVTGTAPNEKVTKVEWVDSIDDATRVTTGTDGKALFKGLENGIYYLVETKAPAGYNLLGANDKTDDGKITEKGEVRVVVETKITEGTDGSWTADPADFTVHEKVANSDGSFLPSTGGIGTTIFYAVGSVLLIAAAAWFVISRKKTGAQKQDS